MKWLAHAPANIALIKYMGKHDASQNVPINSSLSYTLANLLTYVELETTSTPHDVWEPLDIPGTTEFHLSAAGQQRFLRHLTYLKQQFGYTGHFIVRSCNNFPAQTGLASSASSFAALTQCTMIACNELLHSQPLSATQLATLSQVGSGSSCRSFFTPWALWTPTSVSTIALPYANLIHQVVIISHQPKTVSSSQAHQQVTTSPLFAERAQRAEQRLQQLLTALHQQHWPDAYRICWDEFHDMHQLFATSEQPFHYLTDASRTVLNRLDHVWQQTGDGPLVTMDAGPNIHLLYRPDQQALAHQLHQQLFLGNFDVL
ncbi:MAG: diphosphomevalonate decarboxylase [Legionellales bacterium]|nr:diphosphomevalonate decarboxylase [Legionellales bacterium]